MVLVEKQVYNTYDVTASDANGRNDAIAWTVCIYYHIDCNMDYIAAEAEVMVIGLVWLYIDCYYL